MSKTTQELLINIGGKVNGTFNSSISSAQSGMNNLSSVAKKVAAGITAAFAAVKVGQFISDAVDEYTEFEQSMANTAAVANASEEDYEMLEQAARDAGKATTFTASEASDALGYMALAGWDAATSVEALTPVLQLAEATQADLATTSDQVTDSMSAMGVGIDELSEYLDVIVATNNNANTTASDLMEAFISCGGAAQSAGLDYEQTATALGILANNGVKGSEAGTALNSMLTRISSNTAALSAFDEIGVSVYDSAGNMRDFEDILIDTNSALDGMADSEKNAYLKAIAGTNYYSKFQYLLQGVAEGADGSASAWDSLTDSLDNSNGALEDMDATVTDTLSGSMSRFQSAVSDLKISLVEDFGPYATDIINGVAEAIPKITSNLSALLEKLPIQEIMDGIGNVAGALFDFLGDITSGEGIADSFASVMEDHFGIEIPQFVTDMIGVFQDFLGVLSDIGSFLWDTLLAAVDAVRQAIEDHQPALQAVVDLATTIKDTLANAFEAAKPVLTWIATVALPKIVGFLMNVVGTAAKVLTAILKWKGLVPVLSGIAAAFAAIKIAKFAQDVVSTVKALGGLKSMVKGVGSAFSLLSSGPMGLVVIAIAAIVAAVVALIMNWDKVVAAAKKVGQFMSNIFGNVKKVVVGAFTAVKNAGKNAFNKLNELSGGKLGDFVSAVGEGFATVKESITTAMQTAKENAQETLDAMQTAYNEAGGGIKGIVAGAMAGVKTRFSQAYNFVNNLTGGKLGEVVSKFTEKFDSVKETVSTALGNVKETVSTVMETVRGNAQEKLDAMQTAYDEAGGGIQGIVAGAMAGAQTTFEQAYDAINELTGGKLDEISSAISEKLNAAWDTVTDILGGIQQTFTDIFDGAKKIVTDAIEAIKNVFDFDWSLPELKLPHISVTGGEAPFGIGGKGSLPKFSIDWFAEGGIMTNPTAFGINPATGDVMAGGESGAEAIVPLTELWKQLKEMISSLLGQNKDGGSMELAGAGGMNITYSPTIQISGSASKQDVLEAEEMSQAKFESMMKKYLRDNARKSF